MKHTPGPWYVRVFECVLGPTPEIIVDEIYTIDEDGGEIRLVNTDSGVYEISLADAQLIAAAPDLLEACKSILAEAGETCEEDEPSYNWAKVKICN